MERPDAILIAGPTATGKSALAARLAERFDGVVVNADSMQVYRDLRIITARPSEAEEARAPHVLFGTIDGAEFYSVSRWLADVARHLRTARQAGRLAIVVGGTGLYFKALTQGLSDIPSVPASVRQAVRAAAQSCSAAELHDRLAALDPAGAARLRPTDPQRILRALEIHAATGRSLLSYQNNRGVPVIDLDRAKAVFLCVPRPALRQGVDERFDRMIRAGAMDEVRQLSDRDLDPSLPIMRAHGVPPLLRHIRDGLPLGEAIEMGKADTRRYIKRQETFARHQLTAFASVDPRAAEELVADTLC